MADRFLYAALGRFLQRRLEERRRGNHHLVPLLEWIEAQLVSVGETRRHIQRDLLAGGVYRRPVAIALPAPRDPHAYLLLVSQTGSVRKNLNNRCREMFADAINIRVGAPGCQVAIVYLLHADEEARTSVGRRPSPISDLDAYLRRLCEPLPLLNGPAFDSAALVPTRLAIDGRVVVEQVAPELELNSDFFERWLNPARR